LTDRDTLRRLIDHKRRQQLGLPTGPSDTGHGSISRYNKGRCRCPHCKEAARVARRKHREREAA